MGDAQYTYSFLLPWARGSVQPQLSLVYGSHSLGSFAGRGWTMPIAAIDRVGINFVLSDGRKLVRQCTIDAGSMCDGSEGDFPVGAGWTVYYPERGDRKERYFHKTDTFVLEGVDGTISEFGRPLDTPTVNELASQQDEEGRPLGLQRAAQELVSYWGVGAEYQYDGIRANRFYLARSYGHEGWSGTSIPRNPANEVRYRYRRYRDEAKGSHLYLTDVYDSPAARDPDSVGPAFGRYAHHAKLYYNGEELAEPSQDGRVRTMRLVRIDVSARPANASSAAAREYVRRYRLGYENSPDFGPRAFLASITPEGRCAYPLEELENGNIPSNDCPAAPPATFRYGPLQVDSDIRSLSHLDALIPKVAAQPLFGRNIELGDFDGDGFSDVLDTSAGTLKVSLTKAAADGTLTAQTVTPRVVAMPDCEGVDTTSVHPTLSSPQVLVGDFDGNGAAELLYMPLPSQTDPPTPTRTYNFALGHAVTSGADELIWRLSCVSSELAFRPIDHIAAAADINGDGRSDVLLDFGAGAEFHLWNARPWTSCDEPAYYEPLPPGSPSGPRDYYGSSCIQRTSHFTSPDPDFDYAWPPLDTINGDIVTLGADGVFVADMNGDGRADLARLTSTELQYWDSNGTPYFGGPWGASGESTLMTGFGALSSVAADSGVRLADLTGDGYADLIVAQGSTLRLYPNLGGLRFASPLSFPVACDGRDLRFARLGSGAPLIACPTGTARSLRAVRPKHTAPPGVLTWASSGLGATVTYEYRDVRQLAKGTNELTGWVVKRTTVEDHLDLAQRTAAHYVHDFDYMDPVQDVATSTHLGYGRVQVTRRGGNPATDLVVEREYFWRRCPSETPQRAYGGCTTLYGGTPGTREERVLDGKPAVLTIKNGAGRVLEIRTWEYGINGDTTGINAAKSTSIAGLIGETRFLFDPLTQDGATTTRLIDDVVGRYRMMYQDQSRRQLAVPSGHVVVVGKKWVRDPASWLIEGETDYGCVEGCSEPDDPIHRVALLERRGSWTYRPVESWVLGGSTGYLEHIRTNYDDNDRPWLVHREVANSLPLDRHTSGGQIAPPPPVAGDHWALALRLGYDGYGNITRALTGRSCTTVHYEATGLFPDAQYQGSGDPTGDLCGPAEFSSTFAFDAGFGELVRATSPSGALSRREFDNFGRLAAVYEPDPVAQNTAAALPSETIEYAFPTSSRPYSTIHTKTLADTGYRDHWSFVDGLGREIVTFHQADPTEGDAAAWRAGGLVDRDSVGRVVRAYGTWFAVGDPSSGLPTLTPSNGSGSAIYDPFDRLTETYRQDGAIASRRTYRPLSVQIEDAADLQPGGPHFGTPSVVIFDGHGRVASRTDVVAEADGELHSNTTAYTYDKGGRLTVIKRIHGGSADPPVVRWMRYDSLGRLVLSAEPNAGEAFNPDPQTDPSMMHAWRYAWDDAGHLIGTSDPRGCGKNLFYDDYGRLLYEDWSPCEAHHPRYTTGPEVYYQYDHIDPTQFGGAPDDGRLRGRLVLAVSRGAVQSYDYDLRGRLLGEAIKVERPESDQAGGRWAEHYYTRRFEYDESNRLRRKGTGAESPELATGGSYVSYRYSRADHLVGVGSSYGPLVATMVRSADDRLTQIKYGDAAQTTSVFGYNTLRRLTSVNTDRGGAPAWTAGTLPPPSSTEPVRQLLLDALTIGYDAVGNPISIQDGRDASQWPAGVKPVSRAFAYDDLYRLTSVTSTFGAGDDSWVSPYQAERSDPTRTGFGSGDPAIDPNLEARVHTQGFSYDWLGNVTSINADQGAFFATSMETMSYGAASSGPNRLLSATSPAQAGVTPSLSVAYDTNGDIRHLSLAEATVSGSGTVTRVAAEFSYEWDELGQLSRARRTDGSRTVTLGYSYAATGARVQKTVTADDGASKHTIYAFESLEYRGAHYDPAEHVFLRDAATEVVQLDDLGRAFVPQSGPGGTVADGPRVFLTLRDPLGSARTVIDRQTGELVERISSLAYGQTESDYRPERWASFREDYRFTGKEEDIEVGLVYFGYRYYSPHLGRFMSPDPLTVHAAASDLNPYAYVSGQVTSAVDPDGLTMITEKPNCKTMSNCSGKEPNLPVNPEKPNSGGGKKPNGPGVGSGGSTAGPSTPPPTPPPTPPRPPQGPVRIVSATEGNTGGGYGTCPGCGGTWGSTSSYQSFGGAVGAQSSGNLIANPAIVIIIEVVIEIGELVLGAKALWNAAGGDEALENAAKAQAQPGGEPSTGEAEVEEVDPFSLEPSHKTEPRRVKKIKDSIDKEGKVNEPVKYVVRSDGKKVIVDGHHRVRAAKELGLKRIPAQRVNLPHKGYTSDADLW